MNVKSRKNFILKGNIYKVLITLAIPVMINNLIQTLYNLVDGIWVSKLGSVPFAATSFVWPVEFLFISIGSGISIASTSLLSQLIGAGKDAETGIYSSQIVVLSILSSIIFSIIGFFLTPLIVFLMGASGDLANYSNIYLRITFMSMPFTFFYFAFNSMLVAQGNTVLPTILSGLSAIINAILDPLFIFIFDLGIAGAALATLTSKFILVISGIFIISRMQSKIKPNFKNFRFNKKIVKKIIKVGLPSSIGQSGSALGFIVLNGFIASYGTATMAAFGMVNRITSLIQQPAMGIGSTLVTVTGQNLGSNQKDRVIEGFKKACILTLTICFAGVIFMLSFNEEIINFFIQSKDDLEVISQGITYLNYIVYSTPLMGMFSIYQGIFQGSGHTKYSMNMEVGRLWFIRLPMILVFKYFTQVGSTGIWFSMSFSNLIICIYGFVVYRQKKWLKSSIEETTTPEKQIS